MRFGYAILIGFIVFSIHTHVNSNPHLDGWEAMDLVHFIVADTKVYMEKGLEPLLPTIKTDLTSDPQDPGYKEAQRILSLNPNDVNESSSLERKSGDLFYLSTRVLMDCGELI